MKCGTKACFHGAFKSKAKAAAKAKLKKGSVILRRIGNQLRHVVITGK